MILCEARATAKEATIYGFPLVDNHRIQYSYFVERNSPELSGALAALDTRHRRNLLFRTPKSRTMARAGPGIRRMAGNIHNRRRYHRDWKGTAVLATEAGYAA